MGTGGSFPDIKRLGREADHSPPTNAEVKKIWIYIHSPIRLHGVVVNELSTGTTTDSLKQEFGITGLLDFVHHAVF
jgi:hypothetical protein